VPGDQRKFGAARQGEVRPKEKRRDDNGKFPASPEERHLTPDQVEALDKRRDLGHTLLVIAGQFAVIATILLLWVGQDLAYSPGWAHPMAYYFAIALVIHRRLRGCWFFACAGVHRGSTENKVC